VCGAGVLIRLILRNLMEELDYPGEFFYNESTKLLYLW
jgi:hypothetical protein